MCFVEQVILIYSIKIWDDPQDEKWYEKIDDIHHGEIIP
ncbi:MAG: hypothetical protein ANABAC_3069 [Anaerolineae bacterium]|nr:MAG: hypothetical protein ANABAC_3069 [Anaerolineae bacterium]